MGGEDVCFKISELLIAVSNYDKSAESPYALVPKGATRNSNSFTYTLLNDIGLAATFSPFVGNAPGWRLLVPGLTP